METIWVEKTARQVTLGETLIRNVVKGFEWVPGPYGAFVVTKIHWCGDEVTFTCTPAWSNIEPSVTVKYDGEEDLWVSIPKQ